jgi:hypothetical protein
MRPISRLNAAGSLYVPRALTEINIFMAKPASKKEPEFLPDAWARFERAALVAAVFDRRQPRMHVGHGILGALLRDLMQLQHFLE